LYALEATQPATAMAAPSAKIANAFRIRIHCPFEAAALQVESADTAVRGAYFS
jgi:hypothetical protein